jgi:hypothetical protein
VSPRPKERRPPQKPARVPILWRVVWSGRRRPAAAGHGVNLRARGLGGLGGGSGRGRLREAMTAAMSVWSVVSMPRENASPAAHQQMAPS